MRLIAIKNFMNDKLNIELINKSTNLLNLIKNLFLLKF